MNKENRILAIIRDLTGQSSPEDRRELTLWEQQSKENKASADAIRQTWEWSGNYEQGIQPDVDAGFNRFKARMEMEKARTSAPPSKGSSAKTARILSRFILRVAAAAAIVLGFAFLARNYLAPSSQPFIVSTSTGQTEKVELTDGSVVWLNENSSLVFSNPANRSERRATLTGEGFFEVAKNPNKPFIIETEDTKVSVLGTSFNVRALPEEGFTEVQVKTGKVAFETKVTEEKLILEAKDKGVYQHQSKKMKKETDASFNAIAWHTKSLHFRNTPLRKVLADLERYYQVNIELTEKELYACEYSSPFTDKNLDVILESLKTSFGMKLEKVNARNFRLQGGSCQ